MRRSPCKNTVVRGRERHDDPLHLPAQAQGLGLRDRPPPLTQTLLYSTGSASRSTAIRRYTACRWRFCLARCGPQRRRLLSPNASWPRSPIAPNAQQAAWRQSPTGVRLRYGFACGRGSASAKASAAAISEGSAGAACRRRVSAEVSAGENGARAYFVDATRWRRMRPRYVHSPANAPQERADR